MIAAITAALLVASVSSFAPQGSFLRQRNVLSMKLGADEKVRFIASKSFSSSSFKALRYATFNV